MTRCLKLHIPVLALFLGFSLSSVAHNFIDEDGLRQGFWIIYGRMVDDKGYEPDQKVAEGIYVDNKREGLWKKYFPNGNLRSEITYSSGEPQGPYRLYYESGTLEEASTWSNNHNKGKFKRYHPNGHIAQNFYFNERGKRNGNQKYFYQNGQLRMSVDISNGREDGELIRYYANGDVKEKMKFNEGEVLPGSIERYKPSTSKLIAENRSQQSAEAEKAPKATASNSGDEATESDSDKIVETREEEARVRFANNSNKPTTIQKFVENGYNKVYNRDMQVTQVGEFRNGKLWNGKWHRYDGDGELRKVEVYREGNYIGDLEDAGK